MILHCCNFEFNSNVIVAETCKVGVMVCDDIITQSNIRVIIHHPLRP